MKADLDRLNAMAFARHIGMVFEKAEDGESVVVLDAAAAHANMQGVVHGGVMPVIIDAAGAVAILSTVPDAAVLTADLRVNFIAPVALDQRVTATGRVEHGGGNTAYASVVVTGPDGKTLALGQITGVIKRKTTPA